MRTLHGLTNVTLGNIPCGQLHVEEMLENRYMIHWNLAGYKPYMRYPEAGGAGSVSENVVTSTIHLKSIRGRLSETLRKV